MVISYQAIRLVTTHFKVTIQHRSPKAVQFQKWGCTSGCWVMVGLMGVHKWVLGDGGFNEGDSLEFLFIIII